MSTESTSLEAKKEALSRQTEIYKQAIGEQVNLLKDNAGQATKRIILIGAGLAAGYFLVKTIANRSGKKKLKQLKPATRQKLIGPGNYAQQTRFAGNSYVQPGSAKETNLTGLITQQIAIFLIGIATQKLQEYFDNSRRKNLEPIRRDDKEYIEPIYIKQS
ncbi:hypothetical protein Q0590_14650 [Rhodocytophaga aerolata]|uniref:Uncharacterized protein n=1 Tax=Rhodocytophaga aerolata TaxID=455078 RepID=A0ABT8R9X9_9BACT|nr:hypothetical protein [Rhodocytophaga aerolata]MDO1447505.1 hypothetical protein [Rhodocytophaga aerolata]